MARKLSTSTGESSGQGSAWDKKPLVDPARDDQVIHIATKKRPLLIWVVFFIMAFAAAGIALLAFQLMGIHQTRADSLASIDHVILFMQENRAFDHYFGTMAGVRGYSDPNVQVNPNGKPVWYQNVNSALSNDTDYLLPWYLNYLGGSWPDATQCMSAGDNGWNDNHAAYNDGLNNAWATNNTPWSWGHYQKADLPVQFALAEGWTIADMYQESVIASTNPNRVTWVSGSINVPGSPQSPSEGGVTIDNNETPGCEGPNLNCYPLKWKTTPEVYTDAGVSWQVYQDVDNFDDNPLAWFEQYQDAKNGSTLEECGMTFKGLDAFYQAAKEGTLPQVSYIIGPTELSEHPPYSPHDGAWLQKQVVDAVTSGKNWKSSALIISYDETGGWGDHVAPYHSPKGTPGEWLQDPDGTFGYTFAGPGFRLPHYIISPWTRGGNVFTEHADHNSQIMFVEEWLKAKGKNVVTNQMPSWRRSQMSNLVSAFDFSHSDPSLPTIPFAPAPHETNGTYDGSSHCEALYAVQRPPVPYGKQNEKTALVSEEGYKSVRGYLTEGRYLTFEMGGWALTNTAGAQPGNVTVNATTAVTDAAAPSTSSSNSSGFGTAKTDGNKRDKRQWWVIHDVVPGAGDGKTFYISSAVDGRYLTATPSGPGGFFVDASEKSKAEQFTIRYLGGGKGYSVQGQDGKFVAIGKAGKVQTFGAVAMTTGAGGVGFAVFSVT